MSPDVALIHRIATICFVIGDLYILGLWFYAAARTGLWFFWILVAAGLVFLLVAIANVALVYDTPHIRELLGQQFVLCYEIFLGIQPLNLLLGAVGYTMFVRWAVRSSARRG
jgi:heme A synthase